MKKLAISTLLAALALTGCAGTNYPSQYSSSVYNTGVQQVQTVKFGRVDSVRPVLIQNQNNQIITLGGAALGGLAGSQLGRGNGNVAGAIAGAIAGGVITDKLQDQNKQQGLEITVRLDDGQYISITQAADVQLYQGQAVKVLYSGSTARVMPR